MNRVVGISSGWTQRSHVLIGPPETYHGREWARTLCGQTSRILTDYQPHTVTCIDCSRIVRVLDLKLPKGVMTR